MTENREHWSSKLGFILAAVGSAVGLGVLWKFPYTVGQNGGGFFLLCYFICVIVIGIPVLIAELAIGRSSQAAAVGAFDKLGHGKNGWKIAGWLGVISSFLIMSFYSVIAGWGMSYVLMSLTGFYQNLSAEQVRGVFTTLADSGGITVFWHFLFTLITMGIVLSGVRKGIEFWSRIMTRSLFVMLVLLFLYVMRLDGFGEALRFVFEPKAENFHFGSMLEALGLAFFTLSLGQGIMISYGSYMKPDTSIPQMAFIVGFAVIFVAILAALTIFPVVFTFHLPPDAGSGLVFQTLPYLFAKLPGALLLSTLFFTLFVFTALTSSIPFIEVVATNLMELLDWSRTKAVLTTGICTFLFGVPCALAGSGELFPEWASIYGQNFMQTIEQVVFIWTVPLAGLFTAIFTGYILDKQIAQDTFGGNTVPYHVWRFFMRWVIPLTILLIILQKSGILA